jgi:hypothetical protein
MPRRVSKRNKRPPATLREADSFEPQRPKKRKEREADSVEPQRSKKRKEREADSVEPQRSKKGKEQTVSSQELENLVEKVTSAVLEKLKANNHIPNNVDDKEGNLNDNMQKTTEHVQGSSSVVIDIGDEQKRSETVNSENDSAEANVQGSIAAVIAKITSDNDVDKPTSVFNSTDIPIDMNVSEKTKTKIWANEYIDLSLLLNKKKDQTNYQLCMSSDTLDNGHQAITLEPKHKLKAITSIDSWVTAFQIFVGVYTQKYPTDAHSLMKYSDIIRDLALRGFNWHFYDENFRFMRQSKPCAFPWGAIHWELWIRSQPMRNSTHSNQKERDNKDRINVPNGYCYKFHRGIYCVGCRFKHACPKCDKNHAFIKCNFRLSRDKQFSNSSGDTTNTNKSK